VLSTRKKVCFSILANVLMCLPGEGAARVYDIVMARPRPATIYSDTVALAVVRRAADRVIPGKKPGFSKKPGFCW